MNRTRKYIIEQDLFRAALLKGDQKMVVYHLGRVHILAQNSITRHMATHFMMFLYALMKFDAKEVCGQLLRLIVTIPGHIIGRVPQGNIGWASVGLTEVMPIPEDLKDVVKRSGES